MPRPRHGRKRKEQRFYARNALKTTLDPAFGHSMRSFWADLSTPIYAGPIHPALNSFADECVGMLAHLVAYVGTLALLAIFGIHLWDGLPAADAEEPAARPGWSLASRAYPAFAVSQADLSEKSKTYEILRHPEGGRKDVFRWSPPGEAPVAELQIYRPGGEFSHPEAAAVELAARLDPGGGRELEAAGLIDSKFGTVTLLRRAGDPNGVRSCLGFIKRLDEPSLQISGWSCQGDALPARRAAIACMLSRLVLLAAGNEPKLAELFARAELKRTGCAAPASLTVSADWVTSVENPLLRGGL